MQDECLAVCDYNKRMQYLICHRRGDIKINIVWYNIFRIKTVAGYVFIEILPYVFGGI